MRDTLRKALELAGRDQWRKWLLLVVLALVTSGFEMVGAVLVFALIGLIAEPSGAIEIPVLGDVRSLLGGLQDQTLLVAASAAIGVFFLARGAVYVATTYAQRRVAENAGARLSNRLLEGYLHLPYPIHLRRNSAELIRNSFSAVQQIVTQVYIPLINVAATALLIAGLIAVLLALAPAATGLAVVVLGLAAAAVLLVVQPRMKRLGSTGHRLQRDNLRWLQQSLHGIRDVKVLGRERFFARQYAKSRLRLARVNYLRATLTQLPRMIIETALVMFILVFFVAAILAGDEAIDALPVLTLFAYVGLRLQTSLQKAVGGLNDIRFATAPLDDIHADLLAAESIRDHTCHPTPLPFDEAISLEDLEFRYEGSDRPAISGATIRLDRGQQIGICGPTGGGKTTLVDLITGLLEPTSGRVVVDGVDIRGRERDWQVSLGVVPQMVFLIDDSLQRNIALGVPEGDVDQDALDEAVKMAQLSEFVESLPMGLDTVVGERGVRISGGQRQRIAIARALYRRPTVLIFDEGTSALDTETEARLIEAIERLRGDHTIILVAHRLSTVRQSDLVLFVENSRIEGAGSYDFLTENNERFRSLVQHS